jgi:predicted enzyme related to lactoylglutathione lyase
MIKEIAFTVYPVDDMPRARAFYEGLLGLAVETDFDGKWVEYGLGAGTFALTTMMNQGQRGTLQPSIAFEVDDFEATLATLRKAGVPFKHEPFDTPVCHIAVVADPDANEIIIHRRKG